MSMLKTNHPSNVQITNLCEIVDVHELDCTLKNQFHRRIFEFPFCNRPSFSLCRETTSTQITENHDSGKYTKISTIKSVIDRDCATC